MSESEARPRAGGMLFLGDCDDNNAPNAPICFLSVIIKTVVTSATAAEYTAAFIVGQAAISILFVLMNVYMYYKRLKNENTFLKHTLDINEHIHEQINEKYM